MYVAFSICCGLIGRGICQLDVSKTSTDVSKISDEEQGKEDQALLPEDINSTIQTDSREDERKESLAALMVVTCLLWVPILFFPIFLYECIRRSIGKANAYRNPKDLGDNISTILTRDYVPLYIHSSDVTFGLRPCIMTSIIMGFRMIPFVAIKDKCNRIFSCFIPPPKPIALVNKHIFINFNAWVFNGSDVLWASLMESLWRAVEFELGKPAVRWHRASINLASERQGDPTPLEMRAKKRSLALWKFRVLSIISTVLSITTAIVVLYFLQGGFSDDIQDVFNATTTAINENGTPKDKATLGLNAILSIIALQIPLFKTALDFIRDVLPEFRNPQYKTLLKEEKNQRHDFSSDMGFMGKVRQEIEYLFDLLDTCIYHDKVNNCRRPIRLSTFVDDLDRCEALTVVKVLQAMKLLLDNVHNHVVTCYSAIDTRIVEASINAAFNDILRKAKVNGFDYLEKFIEVPFCIPTLSAIKKAGFLERLFLSRYLQNPGILWNVMLKAQKKIVSDLKERVYIAWSAEDVYDDFQIFGDTQIPNFSKADEGANLVGYLKEVKNNEKTSKTLKDMFDKNIRFLSNYSGSEKDNEEVLCLTMKYMQYLDSAYSTLITLINKGELMPQPQEPAATVQEDVEDPDLQLVEQSSILEPQENEEVHQDPLEPLSNTEIQKVEEPQQSTSGIAVESFMQSMVDPDENAWFQRFSVYLEGKPRAMTRIVNIYNVARGIAKAKLGSESTANTFRMKLIVMVFLVELWPYRMSWMFQIIENALEEEALSSLIQVVKFERNISNGKDMAAVIQELFSKNPGSSEKMVDIFSRVSLFEVYQKVARVLMHSPEDFEDGISRDSDPQMFEHLLLEKVGDSNDVMMMSDIIPIDFAEYQHSTLQPFVFNMQSHMVESASRQMENIVLHVEKGKDGEDAEDTKKVLQYEYVKNCFEKK